MRKLCLCVVLLLVAAGAVAAEEYVWIEGENPASTDFNHHSWFEDFNNLNKLNKDLMSPGYPETTSGDWYAHYANGSSPAYAEYTVNVTEGGDYTWWIRVASRMAAYTWSVDGGAAQDLDMAQVHETLNLIRPGINDVHYMAWVKVGTVNLSAGSHTVRVTAVVNGVDNRTIGGIDCMCFVNYDWAPAGAEQPGGGPSPAPATWFSLNVADDPFSSASIVDMQSLLDQTTGVPAGEYGHVQRVDDHFELSERPGVPVKFWGMCASHPSSETVFDQQARFYAKHGVNLVRRHFMFAELGEDMSSADLDTYDQWFAALKQQGVYTDWSVFYPDNKGVSESFLPDAIDPDFQALLNRVGLTMNDLWTELPSGGGSTRKLGGFDNFVQPYQQGQWEWLESLLQHTNPYTGMAYVDDPALAIVEVQNEDCLFWHWPLNNLANDTYPDHALLLRRMWFEWLGNLYADDTELAAAWGDGMRSNDSVETFHSDMKLYGAWEMEADGPSSNKSTEKARMGDFIRFLAETQRDHYQQRFQHLRNLGYQGVLVTTAWKSGGPAAAAANLWADDAGDAIDRHAYFGGGEGGHYVAAHDVDEDGTPGEVNNATHLTQPGYGILGGESIDAGGQDVTAFQVEDKPCLMSEWNQNPPNQWRAEIAPLFAFYGMGLQGWDASLHFSGSRPWMESGWPGSGVGPSSYVSETPLYMAQFPALAFAIYNGHIQEAGAAAARRISKDDLFRGIDPLSQPLPDGGYAGQDNIYTPPEVTAIGRLSFKADPAYASSDSTRVDWGTYWDQGAEVIDSMTGELFWNYGDGIVTIESDKTQGIVGFAGGGVYDLPDVQVDVDTPFVSLLFTPLDDRPLETSEHILITAMAQDKQAGTDYNVDGSQLLQLGGPPLLLQPVQAQITINGGGIDSVGVVDVYGVPTGATVSSTDTTFTIDGNYGTYYYEVNRSGVLPPDISVSPTGLTPTCTLGSDAPSETFDVWNSGEQTLDYTVSVDEPWLSVDPTSGSSTGSGDAATHTVSYSTSGLSLGSYSASITVSDPAATNDPVVIPVSLTVVEPPPEISLDPSTLSPSCAAGDDAPGQSFDVWNSGGGTLDYTVSDDAGWLSVSPTSGSSTGEQDTVTVSYHTSGLCDGTYGATITVSSPDAGNSPQTVSVSLTVSPLHGGLVWGMTGEEALYRRCGISASRPAGSAWCRVWGRLAQFSCGQDRLWGVTSSDNIYFRAGICESDPGGTAWERVPGWLDQVSVGPTGVLWGLTGGDIYCRTGVSDVDPKGTGWQKVPGRLAQVAVGPDCAWGVTTDDWVYFRSNVTTANPAGDSWQRVPGFLDSISVGPTGVVWGVTGGGALYCRTGVTEADPVGTGWQRVPGVLEQVSVGEETVWGVTAGDRIYLRFGVSLASPAGTGWQRVSGWLEQVSVGTAGP